MFNGFLHVCQWFCVVEFRTLVFKLVGRRLQLVVDLCKFLLKFFSGLVKSGVVLLDSGQLLGMGAIVTGHSLESFTEQLLFLSYFLELL